MSHRSRSDRLDTRAWLVWGGAASVPLLIGRHPIIVAEMLLIVLAVRAVCLLPQEQRGWGWLLRIGMIAVPIGVVFNMLTVHAGRTELFSIPDGVPMIGGVVTLNAAVYGLLSGMTVVALIAVGTTVAAAMDWSMLMRQIPHRAQGVAVAGSVAWAFLPQMATSWREIREAQAARGHQWRGIRDLVPIAVPLLAGGLDRSIIMAEALESRGFGVTASQKRTSRGGAALQGLTMTLSVVSLYLLAVGRPALAGAGFAVTVLMATLAVRSGRSSDATRPTRYRLSNWSVNDSIVVIGALLSLMLTIAATQLSPEALRYSPYPRLDWPVTALWLIAGYAGLLAPALVAPATRDGVGEAP